MGDKIVVGDLVFTVAGKSQGSNCDLAYPMGGDWVNSDRDVTSVIEDKVKKYSAMATELRVPLIVVLGADARLPIGLDLVRSALRGQLSSSMTLDPLVTSTSSASFQLHQTDQPPVWDPALSAVAWLEPGTDEPGKLTLFSNNRSTRPHGLRLLDRTTEVDSFTDG